MARPFVAPDPRDRSVNAPTLIVSAAQVIGYYNQESGDKKERVVEQVKDWYRKRMKENDWSDVEFHGSQCLLSVKISLEGLVREDH